MDQKTQKSNNKVKSSHFSIKGKTYFFDVNLAANDTKYLKITESRFAGEGKDNLRNSLIIFPEYIQDFEKNLKDMLGFLN